MPINGPINPIAYEEKGEWETLISPWKLGFHYITDAWA